MKILLVRRLLTMPKVSTEISVSGKASGVELIEELHDISLDGQC